MLVAIGYCSKDLDQAIRLAKWMEELGPYPNHSLLVARDVSTSAQPFAEIGFGTNVEEFVITDDVWSSWPQSANNVFKKVCKHVEYSGNPQPFLWLEPDCVPMRAGWLDEIAAEYQTAVAAGKVFLNDFVSVHTPELDVPDHGSGVGVYPGMMTHHAGEAVLALETAWDVFAREQILPRMQTSELIMHSWKHGAFADWEQVEREIFAFKNNCALFHADKSGSLFPLLRAKMNLAVGREVAKPTTSAAEARPSQSNSGVVSTTRAVVDCAGSNPAPPNLSGQPDQQASRMDRDDAAGNSFTCDILIKSYPPDYELLKYCLRSIDRFASGFRRVVLITPKVEKGSRDSIGLYIHDVIDDFIPEKARTPVKWIEVEEHGDGYLFQQAVKINAHEYTDADYILHIDSDTLLTKPVTPETFFRDGKVLWLMTPYEQFEQELRDNPGLFMGVMAWKPITEKFLGEPVEFEFMRRFPLLIPRSLHVSADVFCRVRHKMSLTQYILSQTNKEFSEFNSLGALAYSHHRKDFTWLDTSKEPLPEAVAKQFWSHDPLTDERREEFEEILAAPAISEFIDKLGIGLAEPRARSEKSEEKPLVVPWADRDASLEHIKMLAAELKLFCTAPAYVRQVREELRTARVIK